MRLFPKDDDYDGIEVGEKKEKKDRNERAASSLLHDLSLHPRPKKLMTCAPQKALIFFAAHCNFLSPKAIYFYTENHHQRDDDDDEDY